MSSQPKIRYTLEEYFELERESEGKYEYWNGEVFAMSGASLRHEQIISNIHFHLRDLLRGRPCHVYLSNARVKVPAFPPYRYPDLSVLCGQPEQEIISGLEMLTNPTLIIEVLSPSTEAFDRGEKFTYYKSIPSFSEYLLVAQHRPHITQYVKQAEGAWLQREANIISDTLRLPTLDCVLSLAEVYLDVTLEPLPRPSLFPDERVDESER